MPCEHIENTLTRQIIHFVSKNKNLVRQIIHFVKRERGKVWEVPERWMQATLDEAEKHGRRSDSQSA